jgi:Na+-driven multidrug efflux pump
MQMMSTIEQTRKVFPVTLAKYLTITIPVICFNIFAMIVTLMSQGHFDYPTAVAVSFSAFTWLSIIFCLVLALPISLIPYRSLSFRDKYLPAALLAYFIFQVVMFLLGCVPAIVWFREML